MTDYLAVLAEQIGSFSKSITGVGLNDIVDMLIISVLIYYVMIWIKETRAWSLLKGFLVILALDLGSIVFHLYTVQWLIQNTFSVGLIALIVIFQPELRKALEQLGKGKFLSSFGGASGAKTEFSEGSKSEVIGAILALAQTKTGALIVIEQKTRLTDIEATGILLDAAVSGQLLGNIFVDKTPLHDGAVLIRRNRIVAATCILPLTDADLDKELGTRHRAAMGLSETCDALTVIVSEESGSISIATGGKLFRGLTEKALWELLPPEEVQDKKRLLPWRGRRSAND